MVRTYRVIVFSKATGEPFDFPGYLYVVARNKKEAQAEAHKEADRRGWFDRCAICYYDVVRVDPTTKEVYPA